MRAATVPLAEFRRNDQTYYVDDNREAGAAEGPSGRKKEWHDYAYLPPRPPSLPAAFAPTTSTTGATVG